MLVEMHPDVAKFSYRFGRVHHHVNYKKFANLKLIRKKDYNYKSDVNNYGMKLKYIGHKKDRLKDGN
jgi:hypothetical protein